MADFLLKQRIEKKKKKKKTSWPKSPPCSNALPFSAAFSAVFSSTAVPVATVAVPAGQRSSSRKAPADLRSPEKMVCFKKALLETPKTAKK